MPRVDAALRRKSTQQLIDRSADLLHEYLEQGSTRTDLLKLAAEHITELRSRHRLDNGDIDWAGRSGPYRQDIAEIYMRAGATTDEELDRLQTALRYHVGNMIRERADEDDLLRAGLAPTTPRARMQNARDAVSAVASASGLTARALRGDMPRILAYAEALLEFAEGAQHSVSDLDAKQLVAARLSLESINKRSADLLKCVNDTSAQIKPKGGRRKQD